jgi:hypothetical protein
MNISLEYYVYSLKKDVSGEKNNGS